MVEMADVRRNEYSNSSNSNFLFSLYTHDKSSAFSYFLNDGKFFMKNDIVELIFLTSLLLDAIS